MKPVQLNGTLTEKLAILANTQEKLDQAWNIKKDQSVGEELAKFEGRYQKRSKQIQDMRDSLLAESSNVGEVKLYQHEPRTVAPTEKLYKLSYAQQTIDALVKGNRNASSPTLNTCGRSVPTGVDYVKEACSYVKNELKRVHKELYFVGPIIAATSGFCIFVNELTPDVQVGGSGRGMSYVLGVPLALGLVYSALAIHKYVRNRLKQ